MNTKNNSNKDETSFSDLDFLYAKTTAPRDTNTRQTGDVLLENIVDKESERIVSKILYYAHPYRLLMKSLIKFNKHNIPYNMNLLQYRQEVIADITSDWTQQDTYGLMILCKMCRLIDHWIPIIGQDKFIMVNKHPLDNFIETLTYKVVSYLFDLSILHKLDVRQTYDTTILLLNNICEQTKHPNFDSWKKHLNHKIAFKLNTDVLLLFNTKLTLKYKARVYQDSVPNIFKKIFQNLTMDGTDEAKAMQNNIIEWWKKDEPHEFKRGGEAKSRTTKK